MTKLGNLINTLLSVSKDYEAATQAEFGKKVAQGYAVYEFMLDGHDFKLTRFDENDGPYVSIWQNGGWETVDDSSIGFDEPISQDIEVTMCDLWSAMIAADYASMYLATLNGKSDEDLIEAALMGDYAQNKIIQWHSQNN